MLGAHTHVYKDRAFKWRFSVVAGNGQKTGSSGQSFASRRNARRSALSANPTLPCVADPWLPGAKPTIENHV